MTDYEKKKADLEFRNFTARNFERPADCRDLDQTRFYVRELCTKIEEFERRFEYVPEWAYSLLAQYNSVQNRLLQFQTTHMYPPKGA